MVSTVIRNLLSNAIKFTPKKGTITINCEQRDTMALFTISDTGIGIPAKGISKLFRIDGHYTTLGTEEELGTGLGLILCKEFVEKNGGKIEVTSEEGVGTTFSFSLPVRKRPVQSKILPQS